MTSIDRCGCPPKDSNSCWCHTHAEISCTECFEGWKRSSQLIEGLREFIFAFATVNAGRCKCESLSSTLSGSFVTKWMEGHQIIQQSLEKCWWHLSEGGVKGNIGLTAAMNVNEWQQWISFNKSKGLAFWLAFPWWWKLQQNRVVMYSLS